MKLRYLSVNQLSQVTGKDRATITKRLETSKPYKEDGRAKIYDAHEVIPIIFAAETLKGMSKKIEQVNYDIEKEKLHKIRTENEVKLGKLVLIDEVTKMVEKEYTFIKAQIKSLPSRLSKLLSMESDPIVINKIMHTEIDTVLEELTSDEVYKKKMIELENAEKEAHARATTSVNPNAKTDSSTTTDT